MASQCIYYFNRLEANTIYQKLWRRFFLLYSGSFIFGASAHLFFNYTGMMGKIPGWSCALLGVTFAEWAMTLDMKKPVFVQVIVIIKLLASIALLTINLKFLWVMLHTSGLLFFVAIPAFVKWKSGSSNFKYFVYSIFFLLLTAPIKLLKVDLHPAYFNRDDIGHVFMIIAIWMIFKGAHSTLIGSRQFSG